MVPASGFEWALRRSAGGLLVRWVGVPSQLGNGRALDFRDAAQSTSDIDAGRGRLASQSEPHNDVCSPNTTGAKNGINSDRYSARHFRALRRDLDPGESESIALALELGADLILLDEHDGRRLAQQQGLKPMGVVGVLLLAKQRGLLPPIRPELDALRTDAGFWLGDGVYQLALQKARESL